MDILLIIALVCFKTCMYMYIPLIYLGGTVPQNLDT